jgi:hypothetical protein
MEVVEQHMKQTRTVPQFLILSRIFNALEIVRSRYRLLRAVTWRYVSSHYSGSVPLSCFYGGLLLDKFLRILQLACESSGDVKFDSYNVRWISDLCTRFLDYFEDSQ